MSWEVTAQARVGHLALDVELRGDHRPTILIGANGAGKTTLLRLIAGAHRPFAGRIRVDERVLLDTCRRIDLPPEARRVGYVPQGFGLFPHLNVVDNVAFGLAAGARGRAARELLAELGAAHLATRRPAALSGGEQQRVALARALIVAPTLLLLDEPLSALDAGSRRHMRGVLAAHLTARGTPAIIVTHDPRDVLSLDARVVVLEAGKVIQRGTAAELRARPASPFVAEFFDLGDGPAPRPV